MRVHVMQGLLVLAATGEALAGGAPTNPPSGYTIFVPVVYSSITGEVRFVKPWAAVDATAAPDLNCTPPSPWAIYGPYDGIACNAGGVFDVRANELYTELHTDR